MRVVGWLKSLLSPSGQFDEHRGQRLYRDLIPDLCVTRLETRRVLNGDGVVSELAFDAGASSDDGQADTFRIAANDGQVEVTINGVLAGSASLSELQKITINGSSDVDIVIADFSNLALNNLEITFNGFDGDDSLKIIGDETVDTVSYSFNQVGSGVVTIGSGQNSSSIIYGDIASIDQTLSAGTVSFAYGSGNGSFTLSDAVALGDTLVGQSRIEFTRAEDLSMVWADPFVVTFQNPLDQFVLDTRSDMALDHHADSIEVAGLDGMFGANLVFHGDADDSLRFTGAISIGNGNVFATAGTIELEQTISANDATFEFTAIGNLTVGQNGQITNVNGSVLLRGASIDHSGTLVVHRGIVQLDSGDQGVTLVRGIIDVSGYGVGQTGGEVRVLGMYVGLADGSNIDASGASGGGTVLIGGDFQGENLAIRNAARTYVNSNAAVHADAILEGNGGKVIIWADDITRYFGSVSVRGGQESGDGGFVEVSGKAFLIFQGTVNTSAPQGNRGTLLLDPLNITITNGDGNVSDNAGASDGIVNFLDISADTGDGTTGTSEISQATLESLTADTDVILSALHSITVEDLDDNELTLAQDNLVIFNVGAGGFIMLGAQTDTIRIAGTGSLSINAVASGGIGDGEVSVGALHTNGGNIFIEGTLISLAGDISTDGGGTSATAGSVTLIGPVQLNANVVIDTDATDTDNNIVIDETISGAHALTLLAGTGSVSINGDIGSDTLVALSDVEITADTITLGGTVEVTGDLTLIASELSLVESTVGGNLSVTATSGNISSTGNLVITGNSSFVANAAGASITVSDTGNAFAGSVTFAGAGGLADVSVYDTTALDLQALTLTGDLTVTAAGITDSGVLTVGGNAAFSTIDSDQTIDLDELAVTGTISVTTVGNGGDVLLVNTLALELALSDVGGNLIATSTGGDLTDSGTITVGGSAAFSTTTSAAVILLDTLDISGPISLNTLGVSGHATLINSKAVDLAISDVGGDLVLTATSGDVTDSGTINVGGSATFTTLENNAEIELGTLAVAGSISVNTVGVSGHASLINETAVDLAASNVGGNLNVTATNGNLVDSGPIVVGGSAAFTTLQNNAEIDLDTLAVAGSISVNTVGALGHATVINATDLNLGASTVGGDLNATAADGDISSSGAIIVDGNSTFTANGLNASITVDDTGNAFAGSVTFAGAGVLVNVTVYDTTALELQALTLSGDLTVTAAGITDSGLLAVDGNAVFSTIGTDQTIELDTLAVTGSVSVNTVGLLGHAVVVNATDLILGTSTVGGDLNATAADGDISNSGALMVGGNSTFTANGSDASITVADTGNAFAGSVTFAGAGTLVNVSVYDSTALDLQALTLTGDLTVTAAGITDIGVLTVGGNAAFSTIDSDQTIDLDQLAVTGTIRVTTFGDNGDVLLVNTLAMELALSDVGGNLIATSTGGNLTGNDTATVGGAAIFTTQQMDASIELSALAVLGSISLYTVGDSGDVTLINTIALDLATSTVGGNLTVTTTTGNLSANSGTVQVGGSASFTTTEDDASIDLETLAVTGSISVNTVGMSGHASLINDTAVVLAASNVGGNLNVTATNGNLVDSGPIVVGGSATFTTLENNAEIELDSLDVSGSVSVNTFGLLGHAVVVNATDLNLGASTVGGDLSATAAGGDITSSGALIVGGNSTFTANEANASITVDDTGNAFDGSVTFAGSGGLADVSVYDSTALDLQALTLTGDLTVTAAGITDSGVLTVAGNAAFSTIDSGQTIDLDTLAVTGTIRVATFGDAGNVLLVNETDVDFGASNVGGNLIATSTSGNLTGDDTVTVGGAAIFTTQQMDASIELSALAVLGSISVNTVGDSGDVTLINTIALDLATSTVGGNLTVTTTTGNLSANSGTVQVGGSASFTTTEDDASIDLETLAVTGSISVNTVGPIGHASLINDTAVVLAASNVGGNLNVTATNGNLVDSGPIVVGGSATFTTLQNNAKIDLDTLAVAGSISVNTVGVLGHAVIVNATDLNLGASHVGGNLNATAAGGDISNSGAIIVDGNSTFTANGLNASITVDDTGNAFAGSVTFAGAGTLVNVSVYDSTDLELQALTLSGDLTVTAAGITDIGLLAVDGNAVFSTIGTEQTIDLDELAVTGTIRVTTFGDNGDVLLVNTLAMELALSDVGGNLIATSTGGNLTGNDAVTVGGTAIFTTQQMDASIELSALAVLGSISVNTVGDSGDVTLTNTIALDLATSTVGGNLTVTTTTDNLSANSGTVQVGGSASFTTTEDDASIDLETLAVTGSISVNTNGELGRVNLVNATDIDLAASDVGGDLIVRAMSGNLTDTGLIVVGGGANFTTVQSDAVISLDTLAVSRAIRVNTTGPLGNATLTSSIDLELVTSTVGGDLIVISTGGDVMLSGTATVGGDVTISVVNGSLSRSSPGLLAIAASTLSVEAADGVDVAADVDFLDVRNSTTGNITVTVVGDVTVERLHNLVGVDEVKTTGAIDVHANGTMTIAESGFGVSSVDGDIRLEANRVEVHAAVTTSHTGDVWIVSNAGPTIFGADGDISAQAGDIRVDSFGLISMANDTVFRTDSGQFSGTLLNSPNPVATSIGTPLSDSNRLATIDVNIQDLQSENVKLEIDWLEGQIGSAVPVTSDNLRARLVFAIVDGTDASPMVQFSHTYDNAPDPANPGADFEVSVRIVDFAGNTIRLNENGSALQSRLVTTATVSVEAPLLPFFPQLPPTPVLNLKVPPVSTVLTSVMSQRQLQSDAPQPLINSVGTAVQETQRYYVLRIVTFGVEGEIKLIQEGQEFRLTNLEDPDSNTEFELSQLPELFKRLPDNRYRIFLIDGQTERLVLDFIIQEGQPIEAEEDVGVENEPDKVRNERGDRDGSPAAEQRSEKPVVGPKPRDDNELVDSPDDAVARLGSMPVFSSGGVLFAAGMTSNWSIHRASNSIDLAAIKVKSRQTRICRNPGP